MVCGCFWRMNMYCICLYFPSIFLTLLSWRCLPSLKVQVDQCEHFFAISSPDRGWPKPNFSPHFSDLATAAQLHSGMTENAARFLSASMGVTSHVFSEIFSDQKRLEKWGMPGFGMPWNRLTVVTDSASSSCTWKNWQRVFWHAFVGWVSQWSVLVHRFECSNQCQCHE